MQLTDKAGRQVELIREATAEEVFRAEGLDDETMANAFEFLRQVASARGGEVVACDSNIDEERTRARREMSAGLWWRVRLVDRVPVIERTLNVETLLGPVADVARAILAPGRAAATVFARTAPEPAASPFDEPTLFPSSGPVRGALPADGCLSQGGGVGGAGGRR